MILLVPLLIFMRIYELILLNIYIYIYTLKESSVSLVVIRFVSCPLLKAGGCQMKSEGGLIRLPSLERSPRPADVMMAMVIVIVEECGTKTRESGSACSLNNSGSFLP